AHAVPDEDEAAGDAGEIADPFDHPAKPRREHAQEDIDADVLAPAQQPRRREQGDQIEHVFGELVARWNAAEPDITEEDIEADQERHREQQRAGDEQHAVEQATVEVGEAGDHDLPELIVGENRAASAASSLYPSTGRGLG